MQRTLRRMYWEKAKIGSYWNGLGGWHIATRTTHHGNGASESHYVLYHNFSEIGAFDTLADAQTKAEDMHFNGR